MKRVSWQATRVVVAFAALLLAAGRHVRASGFPLESCLVVLLVLGTVQRSGKLATAPAGTPHGVYP